MGPILSLCCLLPLSALAKKLRVVAVTQRFEVKQVPMQLSAAHWGHPLHVLGLGEAPQGDIWGRRNGGFKLNTLRSFVATCADDDIILFIDAYDVLILDTAESILAKFSQLSNATGKTLLASAEQDPQFRGKDFPATGQRWRYLNSGGIIGTVPAFKVLLQDPPPPIMPQRYSGDQAWIIDHFLNTSGFHGIMGLDSGCVIFQVTCRVSPVLTHPACPKEHDAVMVDGTGVKNVVTGTKPSVLHFPGAGHWPIFPSALAVFTTPRRATCHYYEVARALQPEVIVPLELDRAWRGALGSVICTGDSLVWHVLVDSAIWSVPRLGVFLGVLAVFMWLCRLQRKPRLKTVHPHVV